MLAQFLAILDGSIFVVLGIIHIYWSAGGTWGLKQAMPERMEKPPRFLSRLVGFLFFLSAVALWVKVDLFPLTVPPEWLAFYTWALVIVMAYRGIGAFRHFGLTGRAEDSEFSRWDKKLFSPLALWFALSVTAINLLYP